MSDISFTTMKELEYYKMTDYTFGDNETAKTFIKFKQEEVMSEIIAEANKKHLFR